MQSIKFIVSSDTSITAQFGQVISEEIHKEIMGFCLLVEGLQIPGITEIVPTYCSVMIHYDPEVMLFSELVRELERVSTQELAEAFNLDRTIEVPVAYGGEYGPDLEAVAEYNGITIEEVIDIHSEGNYLIYMLGFTPGFAYMGGMDKRIATPRLKNPRTKIPAGSVGIAGEQTGIYPIDSPGGWQLIGQTPLSLYDPMREQPILFEAGWRVKFVPISAEEFIRFKENA